ncbi:MULTISPECIES: hypothetical protein [Aeribacillus]|uniref:hypothetical protein n=1 Tax=Aeribacillus TaxID=1055323 RepID=UPI0021BBDD5A|nr:MULTISPECIES: hypothetical protein [Aeribacillus]MED0651397.1 hypothetical protein [Aeribacillus composti]MED0703805.1 hypothetical protein [Aeribacillus composti]MED4488247.1 hypothetical protein [Aeribacillus pallidus]
MTSQSEKIDENLLRTSIQEKVAKDINHGCRACRVFVDCREQFNKIEVQMDNYECRSVLRIGP